MYSNMAAHLGMQYRHWVNPDDSKNSELETEIDVAAVVAIVRELVQEQERKRVKGATSTTSAERSPLRRLDSTG
jgi:hypothetical protein